MSRRHGLLAGFCGALLVAMVALEPTAAEESRAVPEPTDLRWIEASIRALEQNGVAERVSREHGVERADGTRALPVKHVVACESEAACARVARWAKRNGLTPSDIVTEYGHGAVERYEVLLRQRVPLAAEEIQAEAMRIHRAVALFSGTRYTTWMLDTDPEGRQSAR